jgi:DNA-binding response OmpR family regulator
VELLTEALARRKSETRTATRSRRRIQTQQFRPDLILLDYMLPDVNGNIVCQTIRRNPEFADIVIFIVSGVVKQDEIDLLLKSGAQAFVKKPFNILELTDKINRVLEVK